MDTIYKRQCDPSVGLHHRRDRELGFALNLYFDRFTWQYERCFGPSKSPLCPADRQRNHPEEKYGRQRRRNIGKRRYCTRAGRLTAIPRSPSPCRRARPESRGRTLRLRLRHSIDAAAPTANEDSSAASTAPVEENPYAIPITTPRTFPATIQPIIVSSAQTRLSESATA